MAVAIIPFMNPMPRAVALAFFSAILMTLAVPNELFLHGLAPLGFFALAPLYLAILGLRGPKSAALVTGIFGALQHAMTSFWLWNFHNFRFWTLGSTTIAYFIVYTLLGCYLWLFLCRSGRARPLAFIVLWTSFEYLKSTGFLGYPWGLLPYSLTDALPLLQVVDLTGIYGITAVLAACNAAIAELLLGVGKKAELKAESLRLGARIAWLMCAAALVLAISVYGLLKMEKPIPLVGSIDAVLVQQDTDPWATGDEDGALASNISLAREAIAMAPRKPELIIFSETTLRRPYAEFRSYFASHPASDPFISFIRESGAWLLSGGPVVVDWQNFDATNSAILIDPEARFVKSYAKVHPVPFAEAIPFWDIPAFKYFIQKVVGLESGWVMGREFSLFDLPTKTGTFRFGSPICFEDAFPDVCRNFDLQDADFLVNLTNIAWSKTDSAEVQHWAAARLRAIESRRTLVRSTNAGVSCVIGPHGELIDSLPLFTPTAKFVQVPIYRDSAQTVYTRWGDWFARSALLLSAALTIILIVEDEKQRRAGGRR
jgi:apolipoprotein N-acyltransferase